MYRLELKYVIPLLLTFKGLIKTFQNISLFKKLDILLTLGQIRHECRKINEGKI